MLQFPHYIFWGRVGAFRAVRRLHGIMNRDLTGRTPASVNLGNFSCAWTPPPVLYPESEAGGLESSSNLSRQKSNVATRRWRMPPTIITPTLHDRCSQAAHLPTPVSHSSHHPPSSSRPSIQPALSRQRKLGLLIPPSGVKKTHSLNTHT